MINEDRKTGKGAGEEEISEENIEKKKRIEKRGEYESSGKG